MAHNRAKSKEIVFTDKKRKSQFTSPQPILEIVRVSSIKILGVTATDGLAASDHVPGVITSCAQTLYALRVLRAHGMWDAVLQTVYWSVFVAKLLYA